MPEAAASNAVRSILIVGGGTAGWMTAALLNRFLPPAKCRITLVESADVGIIGVGEATVPPLVAFLRAVGIAEDEFMVACHASYKLGIQFIDWHRGNEAIWHPFGPIGGTIDHVPVFHHWLKARREGRLDGPFSGYSLQALMGDMNRSPRSAQRSSVVMERASYAFHLDAREFAGYLTRLAMSRGVRHVVDNVRGVVLDDRGFVARVETESHGTLSADLYLDCSGFAGLLLERALGDPYVSWSDTLLCDRALALPLPYDPVMAPYTRATALSAGWVWRIPLSHRVGSGYVYSSRFISDDAARRELIAHAGLDPDRAEPRLLRMRVGRRTSFWIGNCVAIGLAAGFLEPLESTAIYLIQKGIEALLDLCPDTDFSPALAKRYNERMARAYEEVRDFVILHYALTKREDSEFWKANRRTRLPDSLAATLALYDETGVVDWDRHELFGETSFCAIAAGFERLPRRHRAMTDYSDAEKAGRILATIRAQNLEIARSLPDHGEFMRELHGDRAARPR